MVLSRILASLAVFAAISQGVEVKAKTTSKTMAKSKVAAKDGDGVEDGQDGPLEDDFDAASGGGGGPAQPDPMAMTQRRAKFERDMVVRRAHDQHSMMSQFMKGFAQNMKMNVLADSEGDMPEEERQTMMAKLEARGAAAPADSDDDMTYFPSAPKPPVRRRGMPRVSFRAGEGRVMRHHSHGRMLNGRRAQRRAIPVDEDQLGPAMGAEATNAEAEPPRRSREAPDEDAEDGPQDVEPMARRMPRRRRAFGNFRSPAEEESEADAAEAHSERTPLAMPAMSRGRAHKQVVTDEMGRKMPLLDLRGAQERSGAHSIGIAFVVGVVAVSATLLV